MFIKYSIYYVHNMELLFVYQLTYKKPHKYSVVNLTTFRLTVLQGMMLSGHVNTIISQ